MLNQLESLRIAVLCSRRAPGLGMLLHHPQRDRMYEVVCVVTSEEEFPERGLVEAAGVPLLVHPLRSYHQSRGASIRDMSVRRGYDDATAQALLRLGVNAVVLLGWLYIVTDPMLSAFDGRLINVHDSDLTVVRADGGRRFVGLHSTRDAIIAGATETRSTVHFVNREVDAGPVLLRSEAFPVAPFALDAVAAGAIDIVKAYSYAHREWMMRTAWGPLVVHSLEHLASAMLDTTVSVGAR
jgi:folate-dependent phosphoribosylglycinamide formyltransferase PurN